MLLFRNIRSTYVLLKLIYRYAKTPYLKFPYITVRLLLPIIPICVIPIPIPIIPNNNTYNTHIYLFVCLMDEGEGGVSQQ